MAGSHRKTQYLAGFCASLVYIFTGAVLAWGSPAIPKFKRGEAHLDITDSQISWIASLPALGAIPGSCIGQVLNDKIGRRRAIYASAVPALLGAVLMFTKSPELMMAARLLMGVNVGMTGVVAMLYITEIADKEIRGSLGMMVQIMGNLGSLIMYGTGPFVSYFALNVVILSVPILYVCACLWIPESPYYHLKDGRMAQARKEFVALKGIRDEKIIDEQLDVIKIHVKQSMKNKSTFKELFTNMSYRKSIYIVIGLKIVQCATGTSAIMSYLENIFRQSSSISGPLVSILYGFVQLGAGVIAMFSSRWYGRRVLLIISSLGCAVSLTIVGIYFFMQDSLKVGPDKLTSVSFLPLIGILGFNVMYAIGLGCIPYVMQNELFPINVKSIASSLATMFSCLLLFFVAKCYQNVKDLFGNCYVFWGFAVISYLGVVFVYYMVPETKGKTLEEVQVALGLKIVKDVKEAQPLREIGEKNNRQS